MSMKSLLDIKGIGLSTVKKLNDAKIYTLEDLIQYSPLELSKIEGIGFKSAAKWFYEAKLLLNERLKQTIEIDPLKKSFIDISEKSLKSIQKDIRIILTRLSNIETRLSKLEKNYDENPMDGEDMSKSILEYPFIRNDEQLYEIMHEKVKVMKKEGLDVRKVYIEDLYYEIVKDYSITKEIFTEYLLMLFNKNKLILEPDVKEEGLSVSDNGGNIFKVVRILD